jgi:DNA helicase-2/ATP-dependent DNA helicase PcrA
MQNQKKEPAMQATAHPEYRHEQKYLTDTIAHVERRLLPDSPDTDFGGGNDWTDIVLRSRRIGRVSEQMEILEKPYFGRVDWHPDDAPSPETYYVGKFLIRERRVYSWADTLAGDLFYNQETTREQGRLRLHRTFQIAKRKLQSIEDATGGEGGAVAETDEARFSDSLLGRLLWENRSSKLHDIVATIQKQQYDIIRSPREGLLVVQGAPGSGKTSLALHRIAYLLYNHRAALKRLLILGPNRMFMGYVANILPALGEYDVPQQTFEDWIQDRLGVRVPYESLDVALERLLDARVPPAERAAHYRAARIKGSLTMGRLIDRHLEQLYERVLADKADLSWRFTPRRDFGLPIGQTFAGVHPAAGIRALWERARKEPYNQRREWIETQLLDATTRAIVTQVESARGEAGLLAALSGDEAGALGKEIGPNLKAQIHAYFDGWDQLNFHETYRRLFRRPDELRQAGAGLVAPADLELLVQVAPKGRDALTYSDLAALLYLKIQLDGRATDPYDHIVVDEAQDISPLLFQVLSGWARGGSMTVLGDLDQGIYSQDGVTSWDDLAQAAGGIPMRLQIVRHSYRSTREIIEYANAMLARSGAPADRLAQPLARSGETIKPHKCYSLPGLAETICKRVRAEQDRGHHSIAVICKTVASCRGLTQALQVAGLKADEYQLILDRDAAYQGGTVVIPAYLTKGLEFDTVILTDADEATYPPDALSVRLLYVALTRAAHALYVYHIGERTPLLDPTIGRVVAAPPFGGRLHPRPVTLVEYAAGQPAANADKYVHDLARAGVLPLLTEGKLDATLLELILRPPTKESPGPNGSAQAEGIPAGTGILAVQEKA